MTEPLIKRKRLLAPQNDFVSIYVRNYAKKAITLKVPQKVKVSALKSSITKKMKISSEDQALFLNGNHIPNDTEEIDVQNRYIFHLANMKRVGLEMMTIFVKRVQKDSPTHKYNVFSEMKISDFMRELFSMDYQDYENYFLVYTGREMMPFNSFKCEFVEDQAQLLCIHKIQDRKSQFIQIRRVPQQNSHQKQFNMLRRKAIVENEENNQENAQKKFIKFTSSNLDSQKIDKIDQQQQKMSKYPQEEEKNIVDECYYMISGQKQEKVRIKSENSEEFIEIMQQRAVSKERNVSIAEDKNKNYEIKEKEDKAITQNQKIEENILSQEPSQPLQSSQGNFPESPIPQKLKSKSEFNFPSNSMKFLWNNMDESKALVEVSSKIQEQKIDFKDLLPESDQIVNQKGFRCRYEEKSYKFGANDLMMMGNQYSLGLEYVRDDTLADFQRKMLELGMFEI